MDVKKLANKSQTNKKTAKKTTKKSNTKNKKIPDQKQKLNPKVKAILYFATAVLFFFLIIIKGEAVWTWIRSFFFGIFGLSIVLIPVFLVYIAVLTTKGQRVEHFKSKVILCIGIIIMFENLLYLMSCDQFIGKDYFSTLGGLYLQTASTSSYFTFGGGLVSGVLGYPLVLAVGKLVAGCVSVVILIALLLIICKISLNDIGKAAQKVGRGVSDVYEKKKIVREQKRDKADYEADDYTAYDFDTNIDIPIDTKKKRRKRRSSIDIVIDDDGSAVDNKNTDADNFINVAKQFNSEKQDTVIPVMEKEQPVDDEIVIEGAGAQNEMPVSEESNYKFPPIGLLKNAPADKGDGEAEMRSNAQKLVSTLESFGVKTTITHISRGPSVTRYELQPAPGVKISKITNLADDIALNLAANGVRIEAPIPGKPAVGIEVPNKIVSTVSMRELIDSDEFKSNKSKLTCVLGKDISGQIITTDLAKMPHLLIAGTTGSGKSVCVNSLLISILYKATPDEVKLMLIDPKMVEFAKYKGLPHLLVPVVSDAKKAAGTLAWAVNEMEKRYTLFAEYECKEIDSYNMLIESNLEYIKNNPPEENEFGEVVQPKIEVNGLPVLTEKMPRIVIAIDEFADLMMTAPHEVEDSVVRIAQKARAAGIHLVIATQRPTVNVITGLIKGNVPSRISLKVSSNMDSRVILDTGGAEKLIGRGDMLYAPIGAFSPTRVQGCFATDDEIEGVTRYVKKWHKAQYNQEAEEEIKRIAAENIGSEDTGSNSEGVDIDSKMEEAIKIVIEAGQASTSMIQRRLKVGYARAGRMIDDMETLGVVGPHQGSKPRDVLMTYNEWLERRNNLGNSD